MAGAELGIGGGGWAGGKGGKTAMQITFVPGSK